MKSKFIFVSICISICLTFSVILFFSAQDTAAATLDVCDSGCLYQSIQPAINTASPGDTIRVESGDYYEILVITKSLTLEGGWNSAFSERTPRSTKISGGLPPPPSPPAGNQPLAVNDVIRSVVFIEYPNESTMQQSGKTDQVHPNSFFGSGIEVVIDGFEITQGTSSHGGGIQVDVEDDSRVVINNNFIHFNHATQQGGGVYAQGTNRSSLEITNNRIVSNTVNGGTIHEGGGVYASFWMSSTLVIDNNQIINNHAYESYGGVFADVSFFSQFSFDNNTIMSNTTTNSSVGGVYLVANNNTNGTFDGNDVIGNRAGSDHISGINGGGGYVAILFNSSSTFNNNLFRDNIASSDGGLLLVGDHNSSITGDKLIIDGNKAVSGDNGGLNVSATIESSILLPNTIITGNIASSGSGGGSIWAMQNCTVDIPDARVEYNKSEGGSGSAGGVHLEIMDHSKILAPRMTVISNTHNGGAGGINALVFSGLNHLDLHDSTFERNTTINGNGGGLTVGTFEEYAQLDLSGSKFYTNTAGSSGGGLYVGTMMYSTTLSLDNTVFISNTAGDDGGGVDIESIVYNNSQVVLDTSHFERNRAITGEGGALSISSTFGKLTLTGSDLIQNQSGGAGGGLSVTSSMFGSEFILNGNTFHDNDSGSVGGAIFLGSNMMGDHLSINANQITSNTAETMGGGFASTFLMGSHMVMDSNIITGNRTGGAGIGGGVAFSAIMQGSSVNFTNNKVNDNWSGAGGGGGFALVGPLDGGSHLYMRDNEFQRNSTTGSDGGCRILAVHSGSVIAFERNIVNDNIAWTDGGGCQFMDFRDSTLRFNDNQINNNRAGMNFGGLAFYMFDQASELDSRSNQIIDNAAGITDTLPTTTGGIAGGIFISASGGSKMTFASEEIRGNTAYTGTNPIAGNYGGFYADASAGTLISIKNSQIVDNQAGGSYGGIYVELPDTSRFVLDRNLIAANKAITEGGGLHVRGSAYSQYFLKQNKIIDNKADVAAGLSIWDNTGLWGISENNLVAGNHGSGVYLLDADFHSRNDTIANNNDYGVIITGTVPLSHTAWMSNTIIWGHALSFTTTNPVHNQMAGTFSDIQGSSAWPGAGNINQDPLFMDAANGDYHLMASSPAVDQVDHLKAPAIDHDGIPRPVPDPGKADMGAYEWFQAGVTLEADQTSTEPPGTVAVYTLTLTNDGNLKDTFGLSVPANTLGWAVVIVPQKVTLEPGKSTRVQVKVTVPAGASAGSLNELTIRATSQSDNTILDIAAIDTTVALVPVISFTPDRLGSGLSGSIVIYSHTLTNNGNGTDTFDLSATSSSGWTVYLSPLVTTLHEGESASVQVFVVIPDTAALGSTDTGTVTATSQFDFSIASSVVDKTTVVKLPLEVVFLPAIFR